MRAETPGYATGCKTLENFIVDPRGPARKREGLAYVDQKSEATEYARLCEFHIAHDRAYVVVLTVGQIYVYDRSTRTQVANFASPYTTVDELKTLQYRKVPFLSAGVWELWFVTDQRAPQYLRLTNPSTWAFSTITFISQPPAWGLAGLGWPTALHFQQQRSWFNSNSGEPTTLWGSVSGNYFDFTTGAAANNAQQLVLDMEGNIHWVSGKKGLLLGTEFAEYSLTSQGVVIWSADLEVSEESGYGSAEAGTRRAGDQWLYISGDGTKLRRMQYDRDVDSWLSRDMSFHADQRSSAVLEEICFAQNPDNRLLFPLRDSDGMSGATYDRSGTMDQIGWYGYSTPGGDMVSVASCNLQGVSEVWVAVVRQPGTVNIEIFDKEAYMDSWVKQDFTGAPTNSLTGLSRFNGQTVQVVVDGAYDGEHVVSGGAITTQNTGEVFYIGLKYLSTLETLPLDVMDQQQTIAHHTIRWHKIYARLLSSTLPRINGQTPEDRSVATSMGTPEKNITRDIAVGNLGTSKTVLVEHDYPFPCEVLGIFGEAKAASV